MAKKKQELSPDIVLKNYWNDNEQFADLFNGALFAGEQIIKADELEDVSTEDSAIIEHKKYAENIKLLRDIIKIRKKSTILGVEFVLLGLENQEHIHYAMPLRVMGYDYAAYKKQYASNAKKYKEAKENNLTLHNANNKDLFNLLEIILDTEIPKYKAKEKAIQYSEEHNTEKNVIMAVAGATNTKLEYNLLTGDGNMCTLFDEIAKEGRAKGIIEISLEFGLPESDILNRLQNKLDVSLQIAQEYFTIYGKQNA